MIKVSVIIPTYNRSSYLEEAIISVINQTYENLEIIVVDDGSKEKYAEVICNNYKKCNYYYKENGGLSSARNFGIQKAKGEYIAFLDDDDVWKENKLEVQCKILDKDTSIDCVHSSAIVINEKGEATGKIIGASEAKAYKRSGYVFWNALGVWVVKSPTPLIRKKVFTKDLLFDETIKVGEDIDFYQRLFFRHKVYYISKSLAYYREYNNDNRLSFKIKKYIGVEKKLLNNLKKMGIKNVFILYKIKIRLALSAKKRIHLINSNGFKLSVLDRVKVFLNPQRELNKYSKIL